MPEARAPRGGSLGGEAEGGVGGREARGHEGRQEEELQIAAACALVGIAAHEVLKGHEFLQGIVRRAQMERRALLDEGPNQVREAGDLLP